MSFSIFNLESLVYLLLLAGLSVPLGIFFGRRILSSDEGRESFFDRWGSKIGLSLRDEMTWWAYAKAVIVFHLIGLFFLVSVLCFQNYLPLNPQGFAGVPFWLAFNTAVSFITNTNWQAYSGEAVMSYFSQMMGLGVQNFLSAAVGIAVLFALARVLRRKEVLTIGNFWSDISRATLLILLPLSILLAVILVQQGVPQNFMAYVKALTLEGAEQLIPGGPAASQIAIKQLGTNGGGFFGVNSAHPFENPTPLSNFLQMFSILLVPSFLVFTFGVLIRNMKHAAALWATMMIIFVGGLLTALYFQNQLNPSLSGVPFVEGIETRFGINGSTLWGMATTVASNGSVNAMHSSFAPIAGGIAIFNMLLGEIVFGGVGSGLYGMVLFAILTVFLAGLMVGRTPEYLGRKIGSREVILASIGVFLPSVMVLVGVALAVSTSLGVSSVANAGPHALSEILYAFASTANNNGSAFAGLNANTDFYNISLGICMLVGRFGVMIPVLAIAGSLASKRVAPPSEGTFPTHGLLFVIFLTAVILIVGALTFFPVLTLGPIAEHLLMIKAQTF